MASKREFSKPVYIIGNKTNIQQCLEHVVGKKDELQDTWTVLPDNYVDTLSMERLKEQQNDCEKDKDTKNQKLSVDLQKDTSYLQMDRPQPLGKSSEDVVKADNANVPTVYQSQTTKPEYTVEFINAVVLEEETGLNAQLASFIFRLFALPALILLAIDSRTFDINLCEVFVKELGVLASVAKGDSKLLVVDTYSSITKVVESHQKMDESLLHHKHLFQTSIFRSYFSRHFDWCGINEINSRLLICAGQNTLENMISNDKIFHEKVDERDMESHVSEKRLILFTSDDKEYVCKPNLLINVFRNILDKILLSETFTLELFELFESIDTVSEDADLLFDVLSETCFIAADEDASQKYKLRVLPMINCTKTFDQNIISACGNALRVTVKLDIIPAYVRSKIYNCIIKKGWRIMSSGPCTDYMKHSLVFVKETRGLLIRFDSSYQKTSRVYLLSLAKSTKSTDTSIRKDYQEVRQAVEEHLLQLTKGRNDRENLVWHYIEVKDGRKVEDIIQAKDIDWEKIEIKCDSVEKDVSPWIFSAKHDSQLDKIIDDDMLGDISGLFGKNAFMFFVSEKIPRSTLDQIEKDCKGESKEATFHMLCEWRKQKGPDVKIADLRFALQKSTHVDVNLFEFDRIVAEKNKQ